MKRKDGVLVKNVDPMYKIVPYIMKDRNDALNMTKLMIPEAPMQEYISKKRREGVAISHMALIIAAYVRVIAEYPELNRFIVNSRIYARNEISVSMVVMKQGEADSTMTKVCFEPADTIFQVNDKINDFVTRERKPTEVNDVDRYMATFTKNHVISRVGVNLFMWLDRHGMLPKSMIDSLPFHASLCITNLASIRSQAIFHHIYNFGTISSFLAIGLPEKVVEEQAGGSFKTMRYLPIGVTMDERNASGHVYAVALRHVKKYLLHPESLETPPEKVLLDR